MTEQTEQMVEMAAEIKGLREDLMMERGAYQNAALVRDEYIKLADKLTKKLEEMTRLYDMVYNANNELRWQNNELLLRTFVRNTTMNDIELHKKFKTEGSQDIYEKLDERLYGNGTNAYNLTAQHYCYITPTTNVIPFTHPY